LFEEGQGSKKGMSPILATNRRWSLRYPESHIGILAMHNVANPVTCPALDEKKSAVEASLRQQFAMGGREAIRSLPVIQAYKAYYKQFKKTYHVEQQVESIALKGRSIPCVAALVEAMFMAEIKHMLLTAGHDLDVLIPPITVDIADGSEVYTRINGQEQILKADDMVIADRAGVMSAIIYGPDQRTQITPTTCNVLYTVYAPSGIPESDIEVHLAELRENVLLITPDAKTLELKVYGSA
jgi:DNA/RNA-binding domain of Phe-tRNA-synthetase-like protein